MQRFYYSYVTLLNNQFIDNKFSQSYNYKITVVTFADKFDLIKVSLINVNVADKDSSSITDKKLIVIVDNLVI